MITPPNRGWCGTSFVCTRSITSFQRAPSWVTNSAVPSTESRVAPLSHALNVNVPEIGVTLLEYGPFFTCDSSPSRSSPKALRIGAALSGKGNCPGRIWMTGPPPVTRIACNRSACSCDSLVSDASYPDATTLRCVSMPSFLCESSPTGQYTSYVPTLSVRVSVAVEPGWMSSVSRSMPCPSTSKACGMLPALVTVNEMGPAAIVASDSSTFHSESLAVTAAGVPGARCAAAVASATQASKTRATLRDGTACVFVMAIFLLRVCDNSFPRRWRPHAPGAYSFGNNPAARGVLTRWRTAHPEDPLESSELERFEAVVLPHLDAAYTLARYLTRSDHDAQDVVQDASLRAFRHFGSFRGAGSGEGRAWLLTIAFDEEQHSEAATGEDPEAAVVAQGERVALHRAIDELPPEFREVIVLRELEELSYKEIAEVAGVPVGTVMSRLSRARRRLEEVLCAQTEDC